MTFLGYVISGETHPNSKFFRFIANKTISLGTIVELRQSSPKNIFLGQVIQSYSITNQMQQKDLVSYILKRRTDKDIREIFDLDEKLDICDVNILGIYDITKETFDSTGEVPFAGMEVYSSYPERLEKILFGDDRFFHIGNLFNSETEVVLSESALNHHIAIVGATGSGKSYTGMVVCEELYKRNYPIVIFDPHGEYYSLKYDYEGRENNINLVEFTPAARFIEGTNILTFRPSELDIDDLLLIIGSSAGERQIQVATSGLQLLKSKMSKIQNINPTKEIFTFVTGMYNYGESRRINKSSIDGAISRLFPLIENGLFGHGFDPVKIVKEGQITVIDISGLDQLTERMLVATTLRKLFDQRRNGRIPPFIALIEEVHRYTESGPSSTKRAVNTIVKEGRKFGIGMILLSQRPSDIDPGIFTQCNTLITMRLVDTTDIKRVRNRLVHLESLSDQLPLFPTGRAIISGFGSRFPIFVQIRGRETGSLEDETRKRDTKFVKSINISPDMLFGLGRKKTSKKRTSTKSTLEEPSNLGEYF